MSRAALIKSICMWPATVKIDKDDFYFSAQVTKLILSKESNDTIKSVRLLTKKYLDDFKNDIGQSGAEDDLLMFFDIILMGKAFKDAPFFQKIALACLLDDTPKEPQNFAAIKYVSENLALKVMGMTAMQSAEEKQRRQGLSRRKGGLVTGKKLRLAKQIKDAEMILWVQDDQRVNGSSHQASRLMKSFKIKDRKAWQIIAAAKKSA